MAHECLDALRLSTRLGALVGDPFESRIDCDDIEVGWTAEGRPVLGSAGAPGDSLWPVTSRGKDCEPCEAAYRTLRLWHRAVEHPHPWVWQEFEGSKEVEASVLHLTLDEKLSFLETDPLLRSWGYCQRLLFHSREARFTYPQLCLEKAELAAAISEHLDSTYYGLGHVLHLRMKAWGWLGNARRIIGNIRAAALAFARVDEWGEEVPSPLPDEIRAQLLSLKASLKVDQGDFSQAGELLAHANALYSRAGKTHEAGEVKSNWAGVCYETGNLAGAVDLLEASTREIDPERSEEALHGAHTNLALLLLESGIIKKALEVLEAAPPTPELSLQLSALWTRARILAALKREDEAEALFLKIRAAYIAQEQGYDAALVSLDLAGVYIRQGRHSEVVQLAQEAYPFFMREGIKREALASLLVLEKAAEAGAVNLDVLRALRKVLERSRQRLSD